MLIDLKTILNIAEERGVAVGSFNTPNLESLLAALDAAEALGEPIIIQHAQCHEDWLALDIIGPIMVDRAKKANVPVCVHLDHGETVEYLEKALRIGFTSVMFDGSTLPYDENVLLTAQVARMANDFHADTEGELGSMGLRESGEGETADDDATKIYTDPDAAAAFVRETGVRALACSFGTTHGIYLKKPKLDFSIVRAVREKTGGVPVVMHGGSGVSADDFHAAIRAGVRKINYFTYMDKAGGQAAEVYLDSLPDAAPRFFSSTLKQAQRAMRDDLMRAIGVFTMKEDEKHA